MDLHIDAFSGGKIHPTNSSLANVLDLLHFEGASSVPPVIAEIDALFKLAVFGILIASQDLAVASQAILVVQDKFVAPWQLVRLHLSGLHASAPGIVGRVEIRASDFAWGGKLSPDVLTVGPAPDGGASLSPLIVVAHLDQGHTVLHPVLKLGRTDVAGARDDLVASAWRVVIVELKSHVLAALKG